MSQSATPPEAQTAPGPLAGLRVLDLTRILAGPTCTQLLGDLGAEVIKIERPGKGDDTRGWGPPFLDGEDGTESAYYLCTNRNKRSVAIDIATEEGQRLIKDLAARSDILCENFKVGGLARYGLDYESLSAINPGLIYCSITGFGQTGPYRHRVGYDFLIQGMGGICSITGFPDEDGGRPTKVGVGIADVMTGMYATTAVLSALHARQQSGKGQYIDLALYDSQIAWLINQGLAYLVSGENPERLGNGHPHIVPYDTFPASDGHFIIAVGNDGQFARLCEVLGRPDWAEDPRFAKNVDRVRNRKTLMPLIEEITATRPSGEWIAALEDVSVPCGPVNTLSEVFSDPQTLAREMRITMSHEKAPGGAVDLIGNPVKMSETPVTYRHAPPLLGEHTDEVLRNTLGLDDQQIAALRASGAIGSGD
ncbi:CaiB/BaiF CoA transferase family protein [Dichotomicrobium thermohalophilum]|uniref:Crotonobetainyl-CoA:carnitine CoA-transferase CaiB-like acyl-CoA transferase n=1 Tax=Dichotomicrobium thermohalophilum TaxID=933063 RepID=A0A397PE48_9HYPH|nr:CaiB/BaiF CoA-transferase family protein [Dichotomicrobium thermohalophilum]RIA47786.1 crotonobetainyl-CoA:carnitine CoA-transferase CaiB-like acyl-CoA transferase [Dichotomicrobium thermohalophilum]